MTDAVTVAYVHRLDVAASWHHSMIELLSWDIANEQRIMRGGYIAMTAETDGLANARNKAVKTFLEERDAEWLFWVDTDMGFAPDTVDRLLAVADPVERPVVGGLCFSARQEKSDGMGGWRILATPTIFDWTQDGDQEGLSVRWDYAREVLQPCAATGSACILIHRSVFEKIAAKFGPDHWYDRWYNPKMNKLTSEDLSFCLRAGLVGCGVFVDSSLKVTHQKNLWLQEADYIGQRVLAEVVPDVPQVPPATEPTAVIVPVLGRPQNAAPFVESLNESDSKMDNVYAVVDDVDIESLEAWRATGAEVITYVTDANGRPGTFAEKVNFAYERTTEPWLLLVGDDVCFHPGWLDQAQHAARDGAHVIGTNDMHNPLTLDGKTSPHPMIRRAYVDERGASWDGPKVVCHEGYRHMYVDDEIITVAKERGVWAFAKHAKVEHLHPLWGNAEPDDTYKLGASTYEQDGKLFEARLAEHG